MLEPQDLPKFGHVVWWRIVGEKSFLSLSSSSGRKRTQSQSEKKESRPDQSVYGRYYITQFPLQRPAVGSHAAASPLCTTPSPPTPPALYNSADRHHLQQFSRALKILLLPQAFVPWRRLALQIAALTAIAAICSKRRRILPPTPRAPTRPPRPSSHL